jgi:hypothetical protein
MRRIIDIVWPDRNSRRGATRDRLVYGTGEVRQEEIEAAPEGAFAPQIMTFGKLGVIQPRPVTGDLLDRAHAWLSEKATGPWRWWEYRTADGRHVDVEIFLEREPDQAAFLDMYGEGVFVHRPPKPDALENLAVARGVLAKLTGKESPVVWCAEHKGYSLEQGENDLRRKLHLVYFDHPDLEAKYVSCFGDEHQITDRNGLRCYIDFTMDTCIWLQWNAATKNPWPGSTPEGRGWHVEFRLDDVAEAFKRDWGHVFTACPGDRFFWTTQDLSPRARELPVDFADYLRGAADTYEAPYLTGEVAVPRMDEASSAPRP